MASFNTNSILNAYQGFGYAAGNGISISGSSITALSTAHISISRNSTQPVGGLEVATAILFDTLESSSGDIITWSPANSTRVVINKLGVYRFLYSVELNASGANKNAYVFFRKNGVNVSRSNSDEVTTNNQFTILTAEFYLTATNIGDYFELFFLSPNDGGMTIKNIPAGGIPPNDYPSSPAAVLNVQFISSK